MMTFVRLIETLLKEVARVLKTTTMERPITRNKRLLLDMIYFRKNWKSLSQRPKQRTKRDFSILIMCYSVNNNKR